MPTRVRAASVGDASSALPPLVPVYTKPAILGLPPTAVLTKQEMDFRANLLNPNNDLFWTARGLIRPPVLADALAQGHAILKYEGHLTQKQGGRRLSAQYGRSGASSAATAAPALPLSFGAAVVTPSSVASAVQGSWRSAPPSAPALPTNPACVTKEDMDIRANQLNPNNDVFWSSRGLIRPSVLADALAQGHAILQMEGHLTQTQTHKTRGRLNSQPALFTNNDLGRPADTRRSISGQGLPGSGSGFGLGGGGSGRMSSGRSDNSQMPMAMRRRASTTGSMMNRPPALDGSVTKDEVDLRANLMNPNNSVFWTSRGLTRPTDLQEALAKGHAVLEAEGHITHNPGGRSKSWNRRGSRTELHAPPAVSPLVAAAQRQWSTPFLAPNAGAAMPPTSLSARPGGLPGAAWVTGPAPSAAAGSRHPDWQSNAPQRRRYSLPPPGFELFTPPSHFALFRPPVAVQKQQAPQKQQQAMPFIKEGAADSEWDKMDAEVINRPLAPHSAAIPIIKPTAADLAAAKKSEASAWVKKAPSADSKKSANVFLRDDKSTAATANASEESKAMKQEDKKLDSTKSDVETKTATIAPSEPTTPASAASSRSPLSSSNDKVGSLAWQLTQVKLRTRRPSEARENEIATKSATA